MRHFYLGALAAGLVFSSGCTDRDGRAIDAPVAAPPRAAVRLTLLVVDDPEMAEAAKLLRGEWAERSGGELVIDQMSLADLESAETLEADLVIYPTRQVGMLVARGWLRPVRESVLNNDSFALGDILPLVRNQVMRYGGEVYALSLGEAPLIVASSGESGAELRTWKRLDERLSIDGDEQQLTRELVARAASYIDPRYRAELLIDPQTFSPRLDSAPMVRALEEIVARVDQDESTVSQARITWPTATELAGDADWQFFPLPSSGEVFLMLQQDWQPEPSPQPLTILGFAGRSVSVTSSTRNATSAFKLLGWLATGQAAAELSCHSHSTVWFRQSQEFRAKRWLDGRGGDEAAVLITRMLSQDDCFLVPRIPGIDRYFDALEYAVGQAVRGERAPKDALAAAAAKWDELTEDLGPDQQKLAYRRHLGLVAIGQ